MRSRTWIWPSLTLLALGALVAAGIPGVLAGHGAKIQDDVSGKCPSGFSIVAAVDRDKDKNANGIVCQASASEQPKTGSSASAKTKPGSGTAAAPKSKSGAASETNQKKAGQASQPKPQQAKQIRIKDDASGACPSDFTLVAGAGFPADENANGLVCMKFE